MTASRDRIPPHLRPFVVEQDYGAYDEIDQAVWRFILLQTYARLSRTAHPAYVEGLRQTGISIERIPNLAAAARAALEEVGYSNATVILGDGTLGKRSLGPYDAILVSAAGPSVPKPLTEQLADGGRLVMPLQRESEQELLRVTRRGRNLIEEILGPARFVPLFGKHGFEEG